MIRADRLIIDCRLATMVEGGAAYGAIEDGALLAGDGRIVWAGARAELPGHEAVETDRLEDHPMHTERCFVTDRSLVRLREAHARSTAGTGPDARPGRIIAVGTTSVRTLESLPWPLPAAGPLVWETAILIAPGHQFRLVDALLTNFHLPRSTLLALVAAFIGLDELRRVYAIAKDERYRFYSYGDAMLIL